MNSPTPSQRLARALRSTTYRPSFVAIGHSVRHHLKRRAPALLVVLVSIVMGRSIAHTPFHVVAPAGIAILLTIPRARTPALALALGLLNVGGPSNVHVHAFETPGIYVLRGQVGRTLWSGFGGQTLLLHADSIGERPFEPPIDVHLTTPRPRFGARDLMLGNRVSVEAFIRTKRTDRGVQLRAICKNLRSIRKLEVAPPLPWTVHTLRRSCARRIARWLPRDQAALAAALTVGRRHELNPHVRSLFRTTGQAHLLAVSGLHVGLVLGTLLIVLRFLRVPGTWQWTAVIVSMALYVPLTGPAPSAMRAGLGAASYALARLLGVRLGGWRVLLGVGTLVCALDPGAASELSLHLSFSAVAGILWLTPVFERWLVGPSVVAHPVLQIKRAPIRRLLCVSLAAWLATLPWVALHMGRLAPAGPWASVLTIPLTAMLLTLALLVAVFADIAPLAYVCGSLFQGAYELLTSAMRGILELGCGSVAVGPPSLLWIAAYIALLLSIPFVPYRWRYRVLLVMVLLVGSLVLISTPEEEQVIATSHAALYHESVNGALTRASNSTEAFISLSSTISSPGLLSLYAVLLALLAFASCRWTQWLTRGGAVLAFALGIVTTWRLGHAGLGVLMLAFFVGTLLSKLPGGSTESRGPRTWKQVAANGLAPALGCLIHALGHPHVGTPFFLGGVAFLAADTSATELGTRFGGTPRHVLSGAQLDVGRSGGVSLMGLMASAFFATLVACVWAGFTSSISPATIGAVSGAGTVGAVTDSLLGGTVQFVGRDSKTGELVESGAGETVRGVRIVNNDMVNCMAGVAAGWLAVALMPA